MSAVADLLACHLNYRGDRTGVLDEGPKGPTTVGEFVWPTTAVYDPETDRTRVVLSFLAPEGWTVMETPRGPLAVRVPKGILNEVPA